MANKPTRSKHKPKEGAQTRTNRNSTNESRAKKVARSTTAEIYDPSMHPVDQAWRGWTFDDWLCRPASRKETSEKRRHCTIRLNEDLALHAARMLAEGLYQYHVESLLGLAERTIERWLHRAKKHEAKRLDWEKKTKRFKTIEGAEQAHGKQPPITLHMKFAEMVRKGEGIGECTLFGALINYALKGDAKTAQWILERKYPQRYGRYAMRTDIQRDENGKVKSNPIRDLADALELAADRAEEG